MKGWRMFVVVGALSANLAAPVTARAGYLEEAGWGSLSMLANVVYMPGKIVYAALGGLTGGLTYACTAGDLDAAESVWSTSMGGTYVLTPAHLRGEQPVAFANLGGAASVQTAQPADDPLGWPTVAVEDDDFAGTTFGRTEPTAPPVAQQPPPPAAQPSVGGF